MSQIFDALLRSEMERNGDGHARQTDTTDLLRHVENQELLKRVSSALFDEPNGPSSVAVQESLVGEAAHFTEFPTIAGTLPLEGRSALFAGFPSLQVSVSAEGQLACLTKEVSPTAEAFRLLGVRLRDFRRMRSLKTVLITSTVPQEGKSTVAANLACMLAQKKEDKVLLLEGDVRRPGLSEIFRLGGKPGLCDQILDEQGMPANIYHLSGPNFWILPAGQTPSNPLNLLQSKRLSSIMEQLTSWFDWIIIDSPPVLPLADTSVWMRWAEGILLVVRQGVTRKRLLCRGLEALDQQKLIGTLMNCSTGLGNSGYYYSLPAARSSN